MAVIKKRLLFWLLKAYIKKWGKLFILFFILGLLVFFAILLFLKYFSAKLFPPKQLVIGIVGTYTQNNLPDFLLKDLSHGLTKINDNNTVSPDLASSWQVKDSGKTYIFSLNKNIRFTDGSPITSRDINYNFSDVTVRKPDKNTIVFQLKDTYAPFLLAVSRPIFKDDFVGIGDTRVRDITANSGFIQSIKIVSSRNSDAEKTYVFYPTQESVKLAFALGEISEADGLTDLSLQNKSITSFSNVQVKKNIDYTTLVSLFYNIQDKTLSDKRLRDALTYALPNTFPDSERAHSPLSPKSWAYQADTMHVLDITHAKLLLEAAGYSDKTKVPTITISTLPQYKRTAEIVSESWKKIGVTTKIVVVPGLPATFEVYLGDFHLPKDPDQYTLWHSNQQNNISKYKNLRIDKLLEDGRKTIDQQARLKIYVDFQKYLMDEAPASFLYFPISYTVVRK